MAGKIADNVVINLWVSHRMFANRITTLFKIRPEELRLVALVAALFLCLQAGGGMGDNAASALFLLRFGANFLPYMYIALGGLNFVLAIAYATGLGRFKKDRFYLSLLAGFAIFNSSGTHCNSSTVSSALSNSLADHQRNQFNFRYLYLESCR